MYTDRNSSGLKLVVLLGILNSLVAPIHFVLLSRGIIKGIGLTDTLWVVSPVVLVFAVIPVLFGALGISRKKLWGLGYFTFGSGVYLSSAGTVLLMSILQSTYGVMFYVSIYLVLYSLLATTYVWASRYQFRDF